MRSKEQIDGIVAALEAEYPDADCTLEERDPWKLLVQVRLAAQCTDERVNKVTPALFARYPDCAAMAEAEIPEVEEYIRSCGFYHGKARDLVLQARQLTDVFGGRVPDNMDDLVSLPGVGRKCANVILAECYGVPALAVDTHVERISKRLGLADKTDSVLAVEKKLCKKIPKYKWIKTHHQMIFFGRYLCRARNPECDRCPFTDICKETDRPRLKQDKED